MGYRKLWLEVGEICCKIDIISTNIKNFSFGESQVIGLGDQYSTVRRLCAPFKYDDMNRIIAPIPYAGSIYNGDGGDEHVLVLSCPSDMGSYYIKTLDSDGLELLVKVEKIAEYSDVV